MSLHGLDELELFYFQKFISKPNNRRYRVKFGQKNYLSKYRIFSMYVCTPHTEWQSPNCSTFPGFNHGLLPLLNAIVLTIEKLIQIVYPGEKSKRRL